MTQIQKIEKVVYDQEALIEEIENRNADLKKMVEGVKESHTNEMVPRMDKLDGDVEIHDRMFEKLKSNELREMQKQINLNQKDITRLNDENISLG